LQLLLLLLTLLLWLLPLLFPLLLPLRRWRWWNRCLTMLLLLLLLVLLRSGPFLRLRVRPSESCFWFRRCGVVVSVAGFGPACTPACIAACG